MSCQNVFARTQLRNTLVAKENWGEEMTTLQTSAHLDTMTIPFVSKGQYLVKVETLKEDKINAEHGSK